MKVIVVAGGTGGHFYPGLSVAKELVKNGATVRFIVRRCDAVIPMVEKDGFAYSTILAGGFKRAISIKNIFSAWKLFLGMVKSFFILKQHKPDVLLVMGGYLSIPPALIAKLFKIPIVMHEQNVKPGLANRVLGRWASRIAVAFDEGKTSFQGNVVVTGNPVRPEFLSLPSQSDARTRFSLNPAKKTLLVFGGSLGAKRLNDMVVEALSQMKDLAPTWQVIHIAGPSEEGRMRSSYANSAFEHYVSGYCHDMAAAYAAADVVLCRSGASTVSELAVVKKPALLVPYPFASENHQWANALVLQDKGAVVHDEKELAGGRMANMLGALMRDEKRWMMLSVGYGELGKIHRQAAQVCAAVVLQTVNSH